MQQTGLPQTILTDAQTTPDSFGRALTRAPIRVPSAQTGEVTAPSLQTETGEKNAPANHAHRLMYLDGLRGLAALYVVLFHWQTHLLVGYGEAADTAFPTWLRALLTVCGHGHAAVCVFIVLSGYVLMLPLVSSESGILRGGVSGFIHRRAKRILPTYYAALLFFSGLLLLTQHLPTSGGNFHRDLSAVSFWQHVFLVHNLSSEQWFTIDAPMWSLATEWQIYFIFALVLFPMYRRVGWLPTLLFAGVASLIPHFVLPADRNLDQAAPWFVTLFVMGMGAALWSQPGKTESNASRASVARWGVASGIFAIVFLLLVSPSALPSTVQDFLSGNLWLPDLFCGAAAAALIVACTKKLQQTPPGASPGFLLRLFQSRFLVGIGAFSYSLYLVHQPLLGLMVTSLHVRALHLSPVGVALVSLALLPAIIGLTYGFYLLFERPFMGGSASAWPKWLVPAGAVSEKK